MSEELSITESFYKELVNQLGWCVYNTGHVSKEDWFRIVIKGLEERNEQVTTNSL